MAEEVESQDEFVVTSVRVEKWKLKAAKAAGINFNDLVERIVEEAIK